MVFLDDRMYVIFTVHVYTSKCMIVRSTNLPSVLWTNRHEAPYMFHRIETDHIDMTEARGSASADVFELSDWTGFLACFHQDGFVLRPDDHGSKKSFTKHSKALRVSWIVTETLLQGKPRLTRFCYSFSPLLPEPLRIVVKPCLTEQATKRSFAFT